VLLPGNILPLHIFEPRYKLMIRHVIDESRPFGVVLALDNGIATIGCTAIVARVFKTYEDGRMDIETLGESAYRINEVHQEKPHLEATVELLSDDPTPAPPAVTEELRTVFAQCHLLMHDSPPSPVEDVPGASLAYRLACEVPLGLTIVQELLEMRSEFQRQSKLIERLNQLLPDLSRTRHMRSRAQGNGHGLN
jgi:ATP-dependent Lon protease